MPLDTPVFDIDRSRVSLPVNFTGERKQNVLGA